MSEQNNEQLLTQIIDPPAEVPPSGCYSCGTTTDNCLIAMKVDGAVVLYLVLCTAHRHLAFEGSITILYNKNVPDEQNNSSDS